MKMHIDPIFFFQIPAFTIVLYCLYSVHPMLCAAALIYTLASIVETIYREYRKAKYISSIQETDKE